jgi:hypothetical protein
MAKAKPVLDRRTSSAQTRRTSVAFYTAAGRRHRRGPRSGAAATGTHHVNARQREVDFELDSTSFAQVWNDAAGAAGGDLKGRVVSAFG